MATIMQLVNSFDHESKEYEEFLQDLLLSNADIPFHIEEVDRAQSVFISSVNARLNQSHSRYSGLLILDKVLPQCSKDVLQKYCMLWITKATQVLESIHSSIQELSLSCKLIGQLIIQSKDIPEIQKLICTQNVKQLIAIIGNLEEEKKCGAIYYLIAVLLYHYPEVCERHQVLIKKIILLQIDSAQENLVNASAKCYALLAKATERSFKPPTIKPHYNGWVYNQALICNNLHAIMDELFAGLIEVESVDVWDKLDLPSVSEENVIQFYSKQKQRFVNLCSYLSSMLRGYEKKNVVSPQIILKVLCRGFAIHPSNLKKRKSVKEQMLYLILPTLHTALFSVLDALITTFKEQLVPFGSTILQLFYQTLQWTETLLEDQATISGNKPFRNVRICTYKCLSSWLMNTNCLSGIETVADDYLPFLLKDIIPERDRILLTIQKTQNLSKRALKRLRDSQYEKSAYLSNGSTSKKQYSQDTDICIQALITLQNIFFNGGSWLKPASFKTIQNIVVPILYDCYLSSSEQKFYKENVECRLQLLRVLRILQMNPHSLTPPPTQYSLEIFELALNDSDFHIIQESKIALAELEKIVHSDAPTLKITQVEEVQKEFIGNHQSSDHDATVEDAMVVNDENVSDEDIVPSSNKKLKVTNSTANSVNTEPPEENNNSAIEIEEPSNQNLIEVTMDETVVEKDNTVIEQDENVGNKESSKAIGETLEVSKDNENTVSSKSTVKEGGRQQDESEERLVECNPNHEDVSEKTVTNDKSLSTEQSVEEEEILLLFHDERKDN